MTGFCGELSRSHPNKNFLAEGPYHVDYNSLRRHRPRPSDGGTSKFGRPTRPRPPPRRCAASSGCVGLKYRILKFFRRRKLCAKTRRSGAEYLKSSASPSRPVIGVKFLGHRLSFGRPRLPLSGPGPRPRPAGRRRASTDPRTARLRFARPQRVRSAVNPRIGDADSARTVTVIKPVPRLGGAPDSDAAGFPGLANLTLLA